MGVVPSSFIVAFYLFIVLDASILKKSDRDKGGGTEEKTVNTVSRTGKKTWLNYMTRLWLWKTMKTTAYKAYAK